MCHKRLWRAFWKLPKIYRLVLGSVSFYFNLNIFVEFRQVKGLTTEHGRFPNSNLPHDSPPMESPTSRRQPRNNLPTALDAITRNSIKRDTDLIMQSATTNLSSYPSYLYPQSHITLPFENPRKRHLKSPYLEQENRGSVLRDGSKTSTGSASPIGKTPGYRPASSGSSAAPTEADTLQQERDSPQQSK